MVLPAVALTLRDFPSIGKIRVRLMQSQRPSRTSLWLDLREYENGPNYEGFTRRGFRLTSLDDVRLLREALETIERENLLT
jgi:hypothetical protein